MAERIVVYPGSFNPITNGHTDLVERALTLFDHVVLAIGTSAQKDPSVALKDRMELCREVLAPYGGQVSVEGFNSLLVDFVKAKNTRFVSKFHDHRNAAVSSVYYPQIQRGDSISFFANNKIYDYYPEEFELLIHPPDLRHRPNCPVSENRLRISLNMLISKEQTQGRVFGE